MGVIGNYLQRPSRGMPFKLLPWRREILPSWLTWTLSDDEGDLIVPANGAGTNGKAHLVGFKQPYSSAGGLDADLGTPFECRGLVMSKVGAQGTTVDAVVMLKELGEARNFMNRPIHCNTIYGNANLPYMLPEPYFLFSQQEIQAQYTNITNVQASMRAYFIGAQFYPWSPTLLGDPNQRTELHNTIKKWKERKKYVLPFFLTPQPVYAADTADPNSGSGVALGANETKQIFSDFGEDGHFEAISIQAIATNDFALTVTDTKTKQTLMNGACTQNNSIGTAQYPAFFPTSFLFPAGRKIAFVLTDLSGSTNNVYVTISGRKIYNAPFRDMGPVLQDTKVN